MVRNPGDRFSRVEAHLSVMIISVIQFISLILTIFFSLIILNQITYQFKRFEFIYISIMSPCLSSYGYTSPAVPIQPKIFRFTQRSFVVKKPEQRSGSTFAAVVRH